MSIKEKKRIEEREKAVFEFIKEYIKENGFSPSFRDIAFALHCSVSTIFFTLHNLKEKRLINFIEGKNRTIIITTKGN